MAVPTTLVGMGLRRHVRLRRLRHAGLRCWSIFRSGVGLRSLMRLIHRLPRFRHLVLLIRRRRIAMSYCAAVVGAATGIG